MITCYVSWGSNLGESTTIVRDALQHLSTIDRIKVEKISPWYRSKAVGPGEQNDYINGVVRISTDLAPEKLLDELQSIETLFGRERLIRWGSRTLDLDILLYGNQAINTERLSVPHPRMLMRNFVVIPLLDVYTDSILLNRTTAEILRDTPDSDLTLWQDKNTQKARGV